MAPFDGQPIRQSKAGKPCQWNEFQTFALRTVFDRSLHEQQVRVFGFEGANRLGKTGVSVEYLRRQMALNPPNVEGCYLVPSIPWFKAFGISVVREIFSTGRRARGKSNGLYVDIRLSSPVTITHKLTGARIIVHSFDNLSRLEGATLGYGSLEEAQEQTPEALSLLLSRLSDEAAVFPNLLVTGIASPSSWMEETLAANSSARYYSGFGTHINRDNLLTGYIDTLADAFSAEEQEFRIYGRKPRNQKRVFIECDDKPFPYGNILEGWEYHPQLRTVVMFDPGFRRSALLFGAVDPSLDAVVIYDELMLDDHSTEGVLHRVDEIAVHRSLATWHEANGDGTGRYVFDQFAIDSAGDSPEVSTGKSCVRLIRKRYPRCPVLFNPSDRDRTARTYRIKRALCSGPPHVRIRRLYFTRELWDRSIADRRENRNGSDVKRPFGRGIAHSMMRLEYPKTRSGRVLSEAYDACPVDSHGADALGYGLQALEQSAVIQGVR